MSEHLSVTFRAYTEHLSRAIKQVRTTLNRVWDNLEDTRLACAGCGPALDEAMEKWMKEQE